jgi:CHAD domain-containing protein
VEPTTPTPAPALFGLPAGLRVKDLKGSLGGGLVVREDVPVPLERTFLDTFDWRLHAAGTALEKRETAQSAHLIWQPLSGEGVLATSPMELEPRFGADLPAGPMREALAPIIGPRALLAQVRLSGRQRMMRVLTPSGEPAVRLEICKERVGRRDRTAVLASLRLLAEPGREALGDEIRERLVARFDLQPLALGHVVAALEAGNARPAAHSSKVQLTLEPSMPAEMVTKAILRALLGTMKANVPGVCANLDSEFLHDFRVAVRRMRAALSQLRRSLSSRAVERYRAELTWLGQLTSSARDLDVYLLAFDACRQTLPANLRQPFEPLRPLLLEARDGEYAVLRETLRGERFRRFMRQFARFVDRKTPVRRAGGDSARPIASVARERIRGLYLTALEQGGAIGPESHPDRLHELRKTGKKLRYLMEFFAPLFPEDEILALVAVLKTFQDNLGEIQDLRVQRESLGLFAQRFRESGEAHPQTIEALMWLVDHQGERQRAARAQFALRFESFASADSRQRIATLFGA